ncbi:MAG: dephospho-CoA kinase [Bacteroidota bacterium]
MRIIGLTGGIGSGKSLICRIFEILRVPVFHADDAGRDILSQSPVVREKICKYFGKEIYGNGTEPDRKKLASFVFACPEKLKILNDIVHPEVIKLFKKWSGEINQCPYVILEAAILFESGTDSLCDLKVVVAAPENIRIERVMKRDNVRNEEVKARIRKQWPQEKLQKLADYTIINDDKELLVRQVINLFDKLNKNEL